MEAIRPPRSKSFARNPCRLLLLATGLYFVACAIVYNDWVVLHATTLLPHQLQRSFKISPDSLFFDDNHPSEYAPGSA